MSGRPLTPPYVRFRIRRFNRISAETRTARISCNIRLVRVFHLLEPNARLRVSRSASRLFANMLLHTLATLVRLVSSGFLFFCAFSSTVSICTCGFFVSAIRPSLRGFSLFGRFRSSLSSRSQSVSVSRTLRIFSFPGCVMSVLSVSLWLSSMRSRGCR